MKRSLLFLAFTPAFAGACMGQLQRIVLEGTGDPQVFTDLSAALAAAQPDDKLYLSGGTFPIANGFTLDIPLHFIGAGGHPDSSAVTQPTVLTASATGADEFRFTTGASGSTFTGIVFSPDDKVEYGTSAADDDPVNMVFQRCIFSVPVNLGFAEGAGSNTVFDECIFRDVLTGRAGSATITRSIFDGATISLFRPSGLFLKNSVVLGARLQNSAMAVVQNCVFTYNGAPLWQVHGVQISNCLITGATMFSNSSGNVESNNTYGLPAASIFVNETNGDYEFSDDLHLSGAGIGGGNDGTDIGIHGTHSPYKPGAVPYNPHYRAAEIAPATNGAGQLPVNIRTAAQSH